MSINPLGNFVPHYLPTNQQIIQLLELLNNIYGQLRGYDRWRIVSKVNRNQFRQARELAEESDALFQTRVRAAIELFPCYADKVRAYCGRLPASDELIVAANLPVWTKEDQRDFFAANPAPPLRGALVNSTGGSTGVPLKYWHTRTSWEWRTAVSDRGYSWAGAEKGVRSVYVWGRSIHPPGRIAKLKGSITSHAQRRFFVDSFHFGDEQKAECCRTINEIRPHALVGYAGNLDELALFVREHPELLHWRAGSVVTAAEGITPAQRVRMIEFLGDDLYVSYGSREFMLIGMECHMHRGYHISSDNLKVEVVDKDGAPLPPGELGRIVVTDLRNMANPFIRYEIGDLGRMSPDDELCDCGLPFPLMLTVEGRIKEVILLPDGNRLTALFIPHLMKEFEWVEGYQIHQTDGHAFTVNIVSSTGLDHDRTGEMEKHLRTKVGNDIRIDFRKVDRLQRNRSGKTPIVVG